MRKQIVLMTVAVMAAASVTARAADAKAIFTKQCASCHGAEGKGDTKIGKKLKAANFTDPQIQAKFSDAQMFKVIKEGVKDKKGKFIMKPAEKVTDADITALVRLVRSFAK